MEKKLKHLEFLQQTINRLASNLLLLKGWAVTMVAGMFALAAKDANGMYAVLALFPIALFWGLDAYFLAQERRFRSLYDHVAKLDESQVDFSMDTRPFSTRPTKNTWVDALLSTTLLAFYGGMLAAMATLRWLLSSGGR